MSQFLFTRCAAPPTHQHHYTHTPLFTKPPLVRPAADTAKAFLIILITDILLGYHSEEGWTAFLRIASRHYGVEPEVGGP